MMKYGGTTNMIKKEEFDNIIKENVIKKYGQSVLGYKTDETEDKIYENYYNASEFDCFLNDMKASPYSEIYRSYHGGNGGELVSHGKKPPKMASVASSSRFCYLALRDGAQGLGSNGTVKFEYECEIDEIKGGAPQLDAYIPNDNIYVEVKCHEIFDSHKIKMSKQYWKYLRSEGNCFGLSTEEEEKEVTIELSEFGLKEKSSMFDIKQLLCHLLGIQSENKGQKPAMLVYLFFKPKAESEETQKQIDKVFDSLTTEIKTIFNSAPIQRFIADKNIQLRAIAEYSEVFETLNKNNVITLYPQP